MDEAVMAEPPSPSLQGRTQGLWREQHPLGSCLWHHVRSEEGKRGQGESKGADVLAGHHRSSSSPPVSCRNLRRVSIFCHCRSMISRAMILPASSLPPSCNNPRKRVSFTSIRYSSCTSAPKSFWIISLTLSASR